MSPRHLPVKVCQVSDGALCLTIGGDKRAVLYLYFLNDSNRDVDPRHLKRTDAIELAKHIARTLTDAWQKR